MSQGGGAEEEESMHTFCIKTKAHCSCGQEWHTE